MNKQLEQLCESLFERCKKDIDGIFSLWKESIRVVPNGDGTSNQDYIKIFLKNNEKWKPICDVYPSNSKVKFEKDNSKLKLFDLIKKQLNHYGYMDIEESEFYREP